MKSETGLQAGLEIHQQLATRHKLFCKCSAGLQDKDPVFEIKRKMRVVAGELGDIDAAAKHEALKNRVFKYSVYKNESCAVELDDEPPHSMNPEALGVGLRIAIMLNCSIPDSIEVMRKTVLDGSAVSGFQRTTLVGVNGYMETRSGRVGIDNVNVEEDACQILKKEKDSVAFGLNRLGIPLIEIGTAPDIRTPEQAKEVAEKLGSILRGTGNVRRGIGTIRQDLNVSIRGGTRVEIKGVQELKMIPKIIEKEVKRQEDILRAGKSVEKEVRKAEPDGSTTFLRPLSSSARLYPETDVPSITVIKELLESASEISVAEKEIERHVNALESAGFAKDVAKAMVLRGSVKPGQLSILESLLAKYKFLDKKLVYNVAIEMPRDAKARYGSDISRLTESHFDAVLGKLSMEEISKEAIPDILDKFSRNPERGINEVMQSLGIKMLSHDELRKIVRKVIVSHKELLGKPSPEKPLMGLVMKEVRGKVPGDAVMKVLKEEIQKEK